MSIPLRIKELIDEKKLNISSFEKEIDAGNGSIRSLIDRNQHLSGILLSKILNKFPNINANWLITGVGDMYNNSNRSHLMTNDKISRVSAVQNIIENQGLSSNPTALDKSIPLVSVKAIGGFGNIDFSISERDVKAYYVIPKFRHKTIDFMIEVEGSSMYPKYNSGDVVACTIIRESKFIQWNKTHVIATREQGILIKRIKKSDNNDTLQMVSDNKDYDPFNVPETEITGIALVVGVIRLE